MRTRTFAIISAAISAAVSVAVAFAPAAQASTYGGRMTAGDCANLGGTWTPDGTTNSNGTPLGRCN